MSNWTYLNGSVQLSAPVVKERGKLFDIEKQICRGRSEWSMGTSVDLCAFPVWKDYIEDTIAQTLPSGEYNVIRHTLVEGIDHTYSSSDEGPVIEKYVKKHIFPDADENTTIFYEFCNEIFLGFNSKIRYCVATELMSALIKFFEKLEEKDITIETGYLEWTSGNNYICAMRKDFCSNDISFMFLDSTTNTILASRTIKHHWKHREYIKTIEVSDTWSNYMKEQ